MTGSLASRLKHDAKAEHLVHELARLGCLLGLARERLTEPDFVAFARHNLGITANEVERLNAIVCTVMLLDDELQPVPDDGSDRPVSGMARAARRRPQSAVPVRVRL